VHQCTCLKDMVGWLSLEVTTGKLPKLVVDQWDNLAQGFLVTLVPADEQFSHLSSAGFVHGPFPEYRLKLQWINTTYEVPIRRFSAICALEFSRSVVL